VIPDKALYVAQKVVAQAKISITLVVSQPNQPVSNALVFIRQLRPVAVATFTDQEEFTCPPNADAVL